MEDTYNMNFPTVPKSAEDFKPDERLTRGEFVMEALNIWEEQMTAVNRAIARGGHSDANRNKLLARHMDMKIAIRVLKNTYFAEELCDMEFYEQQMKEGSSENS